MRACSQLPARSCDDLGVTPAEGPDSLSACALWISAWVDELERDALRARVNRSFTIARSHYAESINWKR
jgi:hypothetical protein